MEAIKKDITSEFDQILKQQFSDNLAEFLFMVLEGASTCENENLVERLIDRGANIHFKDCYNNTLLHKAAEKGYLKAVEILLDKNIDVQAVNTNRYTALHVATQGNQIAVSKLLISKGLDIEAKDKCGYTPLQHAIIYNNVEMVKFLVNQNANVNTKPKFSFLASPLLKAVRRQNIEIAALLMAKGAKYSKREPNHFHIDGYVITGEQAEVLRNAEESLKKSSL